MFIYTWLGIDHEGKIIRGKESAKNKKQLKIKLAKKNILPLKIKLSNLSYLKFNKKIKTKYIIFFIEQLSSLINSNIPLAQALTIINQEEKNHNLKKVVADCKTSISEGTSLHETLQQHPQHFNKLICGLIKAGEESGTLDVILKDLANHLKKSQSQKNKAKKALIYPGILLATTIATTSILLIFVIPELAIMFDNFEAGLPNYTKFIINLSNILKKHWQTTLISLFIITFAAKTSLKRSENLRYFLDKLSLKTPIIKKIIINANIASFTNTLSLMLSSGIPLLSAINISSDTISNRHYKKIIRKARKSLTNGKTLHEALCEQKTFPNKMTQLINMGEETGNLDYMLKKISIIYNDKLNEIIDNLNSLLEPIMILTLGSIIGGLIIGMYLPIFRLGTII